MSNFELKTKSNLDLTRDLKSPPPWGMNRGSNPKNRYKIHASTNVDHIYEVSFQKVLKFDRNCIFFLAFHLLRAQGVRAKITLLLHCQVGIITMKIADLFFAQHFRS